MKTQKKQRASKPPPRQVSLLPIESLRALRKSCADFNPESLRLSDTVNNPARFVLAHKNNDTQFVAFDPLTHRYFAIIGERNASRFFTITGAAAVRDRIATMPEFSFEGGRDWRILELAQIL